MSVKENGEKTNGHLKPRPETIELSNGIDGNHDSNVPGLTPSVLQNDFALHRSEERVSDSWYSHACSALTESFLLIWSRLERSVNNVRKNVTSAAIFTGEFWRTYVIDKSNDDYYYWLMSISLAVLYNIIVIPLRIVFVDVNNSVRIDIWFTLDYICDAFYLIDIFVRMRTGFYEQGLLVTDKKRLRMQYLRSIYFILDLVSVLPTDLLYLVSPHGVLTSIVRINRFFKLQRLFEFSDRSETRSTYPNVVRIIQLTLELTTLLHWNACAYFLLCTWIGLSADTFVYPPHVSSEETSHGEESPWDTLSRKYLYRYVMQACVFLCGALINFAFLCSLFWATMALTTIGEVPAPVTNVESLFIVINFLIGVLMFATLVGNVFQIIENLSTDRQEFQRQINAVKAYMHHHNVNAALQARVIKWFEYVWSHMHSLDDDSMLAMLPDKLRAEIGLSIHYESLKRVAIFQDCEAGLLSELLMKLKQQVFSPGDYVCRKGNIGKEMYIIKQGKLQVVSDDGKQVFATLNEGSVFGEVSILNIWGNKTGNRRTANVRSMHYSVLFVLSKDDLWDTLEHYPEAKKRLIARGTEILKKDDLFDEKKMKEAQKRKESMEEKLRRFKVVIDFVLKEIEEIACFMDGVERKLNRRASRLEVTLGCVQPAAVSQPVNDDTTSFESTDTEQSEKDYSSG